VRLPCAVRCESTATSPKAPESRLERDQVPSYELTFTCNVCKTRSSHRLSKQGYHKGTILIACPDCKNRHLISDHLKVSERMA
jgi:protein import protein ZIM17